MKKEPIPLEKIKKIQLELLDSVDKFCVEHHIKYSLAFGTLLGAVRHGGYIPWDDDIDIMMTRENYNRFREEYQSECYPFVDMKTDENHPVPLGKVYDSSTFFYYKKTIRRKYGVFIDIFPIDNMPEDIDVRTKWIKKVNHYIKLNYIKCNSWGLILNSNKNVLKKLFFCAIKLLTSSKYIHKRLENLYIKYENEDTNYVGAAMIFNYMDVWRVYPKSCFNEYGRMMFEGKEYMAICDYDTFLKIRYGDYMKLPPENERVPKHGIIAYNK